MTSRVDDGHLGFLLETEEQKTWGAEKDHQRATLTRAEAATMVARVLDETKRVSEPLTLQE